MSYSIVPSAFGAGLGCIGVALVAALNMSFYLGIAALLGLWTDRNLDFWVSHYQGVATDVPFWLSWLASIPIPFTFCANIVAEIAKFFI